MESDSRALRRTGLVIFHDALTPNEDRASFLESYQKGRRLSFTADEQL
jgi:hypothetical protein